MIVLICNFFIKVQEADIYNFFKDILVPSLSICASAWIAFYVANRQIQDQRRLNEDEEKKGFYLMSLISKINFGLKSLKAAIMKFQSYCV